MMKVLIWILPLILIITSSCDVQKENKVDNIKKNQLTNDTLIHENDHFLKFQGLWQAENDKNYFIKIKDDSLIQMSDDEVLSASEFYLLKKCEETQEDLTIQEREFIAFYIENKFECAYEILSDGKKALTLMDIDNGRITIFKRIK